MEGGKGIVRLEVGFPKPDLLNSHDLRNNAKFERPSILDAEEESNLRTCSLEVSLRTILGD